MKKILLKLSMILVFQPFILLASNIDTTSYFGAYTCWTYKIEHYNDAGLYMFSSGGEIQGDTLINNKVYKKYVRNGYGEQNIIALRQENKKIYVINNQSDNEYLLYDFGLEVGDSISYEYQGQQRFAYVEIIDSIMLDNGNKYKKMYLFNELGQTVWVEGIGNFSTRRGFENPYPYMEPTCICGDYYYIRCFTREYEQVILNPSQSSVECSCRTYDNIEIATFRKDKLLLYQNNDFLYFTVDNNIIKTVETFDINGKIVMNETGVSKIKISTLPNGIYFIRVVLQNNSVLTAKWLKL